MRLGFKPTAGADPVQVAVNVKLQQVAWSVRRPPHFFCRNPGKAQFPQVERVYEGINHPNRIVAPNYLVQNLRKQGRLIARRSGEM